MPNRIIKESVKRSPQIDELTWFEEVVFYRLVVTADDYGRCDGRMVLLKNELFPTKDTVTRKAVEDAINKLVSVGLLCKYTVSGMPYLFFPSWQKHQRIRNMQGRYPAPPEELSADCGQLSADCGQLSADCGLESESEIESESESEDNAPAHEKPAKEKYGKHENVLLTTAEFEKLVEKFPDDYQERIENLSWYMPSKGVSYKNHYLTILNWDRKAKEREEKEKQKKQEKPKEVSFMDIDF